MKVKVILFIIRYECITLKDYFAMLLSNQSTEPLLEAILGHRSAASFPTGPVIADPFISPLGLIMTPALSKL